MGKYEVQTLSGTFVFDASDVDQATRLGQDGGRVVVNVSELPDDDSDIEAQHEDGDDADSFSDSDDVVVLRQRDYDRLVAYARQGGMDEATAAEIANPAEAVEVSDEPESGTVAPGATTGGTRVADDGSSEDHGDGDTTPTA